MQWTSKNNCHPFLILYHSTWFVENFRLVLICAGLWNRMFAEALAFRERSVHMSDNARRQEAAKMMFKMIGALDLDDDGEEDNENA